MKRQRGNPGLKGRLVDKSLEAYILALETINRLSIHYRIETFCYLICNAWELMLKAKILEDEKNKNAIYYKKPHGQPRRSLSLRDCLNKTFPNQNDPLRRNIERITNLRDESVHLVFRKVPGDVLGLLQACVLNYHKTLNQWFGVCLSDRVPVGMMTIVYDLAPNQDMSVARLRKELGKDAADFLDHFARDIKTEFEQLRKPAAFSIGIEYKLVLTKKTSDADIELTTGSTGRTTTRVVEVPKDPSKSHPFRQKEVIQEVKKRAKGAVINQHDIQCVNKVHGIKQCPEYFYQGSVKGSPAQYSQAFVDWLLKQCQSDSSFFQKARASVKKRSQPS